VCALIVPGCLVPQSIDPLPVEPHPTPYFLVGEFDAHLNVPQLQLYRQGSADATHTPLPCHCELHVPPLPIFEADPTVNMIGRWFLDYDASVPNTTRIQKTDPLPGTFNDPTLTKRSSGTFVFDADALQITTSGAHVLELVVGEDTHFDDTNTTQPFRSMQAGYTPAVYRFVINLQREQDPARPTCPNEGLSFRVCQ
jgi:hypothetical protein